MGNSFMTPNNHYRYSDINKEAANEFEAKKRADHADLLKRSKKFDEHAEDARIAYEFGRFMSKPCMFDSEREHIN